MKHKKILERALPDALKLSIAKKIENNLFSKVFKIWFWIEISSYFIHTFQSQITFLSGLKAMGEIRALFAAEVTIQYVKKIKVSLVIYFCGSSYSSEVRLATTPKEPS